MLNNDSSLAAYERSPPTCVYAFGRCSHLTLSFLHACLPAPPCFVCVVLFHSYAVAAALQRFEVFVDFKDQGHQPMFGCHDN